MFFAISPFIVIFSLILQTSFLPVWPLWGVVVPDLNLIVVTCFSWTGGPVRGTVFAFIAGTMQDFISLKSLGACALSKTCIGFLTGTARENSKSKFLLPLFLVFINTLINEIVYIIFYFALGSQKALPPDIISKILLQISANLLFAPVFLIIFNKLAGFFNPREITI